MTIAEARKLLGKKANNFTDEEVWKIVDDMRSLADLIIDKYLEMSPEEKKWYKEHSQKSKIEFDQYLTIWLPSLNRR